MSRLFSCMTIFLEVLFQIKLLALVACENFARVLRVAALNTTLVKNMYTHTHMEMEILLAAFYLSTNWWRL